MCLICYFLPPLQWDPAEVHSQSSTPERGGLALSPPSSHPGLWLPAAAEPLTASLLRSLWPRSGTEKYPLPLPPDTIASLSFSLGLCQLRLLWKSTRKYPLGLKVNSGVPRQSP